MGPPADRQVLQGAPSAVAVFLVSPVDDAVSEALQAIRFQPLTWLMILASAWWVKSLVVPALGGIGDLRLRRLPWTLAFAALAALASWPLTREIKQAVGRARPPVADHAIHAAVKLPHDSSFPSGHAAQAFAAATVVALLRPGWRWPALALAAVIAFSRIYLGVHFLTDVLGGAALGAAVGLALVVAVRRADSSAGSGTSRGRRRSGR